MKESSPKSIRERIDSLMGAQPTDDASGRRRSILKAAWERLTPAEEWASHRSLRLTPSRRSPV